MATLSLKRGDDYAYAWQVLQPNGTTPQPLTGWTLWWTVKGPGAKDTDDSNATISYYWVSGGASFGLSVADPTTGVVALVLPASLTTTLLPNTQYTYDVQRMDAAGKIKTIDVGSLSVSTDVTRRITVP